VQRAGGRKSDKITEDIKSPEAVRNADAIAAVDGVDVLLIGSFDLTSELGIPGQMSHAKLIDAYQIVSDACRRHGKALSMGGINDDENARRYISMEARLITNQQRSQLHSAGSIERAQYYRELAASGAGVQGTGRTARR
jgi:2-keto-3-deoxy-L-rhamnonate aldolase RhmA